MVTTDFELGSALLFALTVLILVAGLVQLAGFFPLRELPPKLSGSGTRALILGDAAVLLALLGSAALVATRALTWPQVVIIGGLAVLAGPLLFQVLPVRFRDSRSGLGALFCTGVAIVLAVWTQTPM